MTIKVIKPLREGFSEEVVDAIEPEFQMALYGEKGTTKKSRQTLIFGATELRWLAEEAKRIAAEAGGDAKQAKALAEDWRKSLKNNLKAMTSAATLPGGLASALFGRMVTSDPEANITAPVHVAHAFTVREQETESDYFTAVDDLAEDEPGADTIQETELTSGLFYGYAVIDIPGLVDNLGGDRDLSGQVIHNLVYLIAEVSRGRSSAPPRLMGGPGSCRPDRCSHGEKVCRACPRPVARRRRAGRRASPRPRGSAQLAKRLAWRLSPGGREPAARERAMSLRLIRLPIRLGELAHWAADRGLMHAGGFDEGRALHHLLGETFGPAVLQPSRLLAAPRGGTANLYAYGTVEPGLLRETAHAIALPDALPALRIDRLEAKAMPGAWRPGQRLGFDILTRPVVRLAKPVPAHADARGRPQPERRAGAETDAFLAHVLRGGAADDPPDAVATREAVYLRWLADRLAPAARLEEGRMTGFQHRRAARTSVSEGPEATLQGTLEIADPEQFVELLTRGVGRHRAYGYGMLLLRAPGRPAPES